MPTNLYGPGNDFDLAASHVLPALIRKTHEAKRPGDEIVIWGTGTPRCEFLHVDDCADAAVFLLQHYSGDRHINVGSGTDVTILQLAEIVAEVVGFRGRIVSDMTKPSGTAPKLMSADVLRTIRWVLRIPLVDGICSTYAWFLGAAKDAA